MTSIAMEDKDVCEEFKHEYFAEDWSLCLNISANDTIFNPVNWTRIYKASQNHSCTDYYFHEFVTYQPQVYYSVIIPIVCFLGIVGNVLNILVMTRGKLLVGMDTLERSATYGLICLALSDLLFCLLVFPNAVVSEQASMVFATSRHALQYRLYSLGAVNTFVMTSSWLIVIIAANRLIVVIYPLHARLLISGAKTALAILVIFVLSAVVTVPYYLIRIVQPCTSPDGTPMVEARSRYDADTTQSLVYYVIYIWPLLSHFVPFAVILVCNAGIILTLRRAAIQRSVTTQKAKDSSRKVTLTLIAIVFLYCLLVFPGEVLKFLDHSEMSESILIVQGILNVMNAINFAFNFVLYCLVNPTFRSTTKALLLCQLSKARQSRQPSSTRMTELRSRSTTKPDLP